MVTCVHDALIDQEPEEPDPDLNTGTSFEILLEKVTDEVQAGDDHR